MTEMGLDIEAIEALDFEFAPPCDNKDGCDGVAAWKCRAACCGQMFLLCNPCKELQDRVIALLPNEVGTCILCDRPVAYKDFLFSVERL